MHSSKKHDFQAATAQARDESIFESELSILRDVFRLLPAGVTVQDEHGEFVLMNDAATALLEAAAAAPSAAQPGERRDTCLELLRNGRSRSPGAIC
jgi:PAS domain-containing protein